MGGDAIVFRFTFDRPDLPRFSSEHSRRVSVSPHRTDTVPSRGRPKAEVLLSAENRKRNRKYADADSAARFLGYLYIVSQYTVRLMTPCVWRILCLHNSSSVAYFRQPPNLPTAFPPSLCPLHRNRSAPNVVRLLSAETECPPKVPI